MVPFILYFGLLVSHAVNGKNLEATIVRDLLDGYDPRAFPLDDDKSVVVNVSYFLMQLQGLDEKEQTLTTMGTMDLGWYDSNLIWKTNDMKRNFVILKSTDIWKPTIVVGNSIQDEVEDVTERKSTRVRCNKGNGHVKLTTFGKDTTFCPMNLRYFPFDKHTCKIEFNEISRFGFNISNEQGNYYYERKGIMFQNDPANANHQFLTENGEWELLSLKLDTSPRIDVIGETIINYAIYTVTVELQRKPSFYVMILMVPSILIGSISVIGFLLPSESGEKVSLQLTALLSYSLVFLVVVDIIPPIGGNFPLIAQILIAGQVSTTFNLILTVLFLRLFHHEPSPVPSKLRYFVFKIVAPVIFYDVYMNGNSENVFRFAQKTQSKKESKQNSTECKEKVTMETFLEFFKAFKQLEGSEDEMYTREWQTIAKILDRLLFILNVISFVIAFGYGYTAMYTH